MRIQSSDKWQQVEAVFGNAVELPASSRAAYVADSCSTDPELRAEVERLLRASDRAGDFLTALDGHQAAALLDSFAESEEAKFIGRYKVIRQLGSGGMGVVYLAEDPSLKRLVAVKVLPPYLHADSIANRRFLDEARAASALDHPNIATVHEIGETEDGRLFITMSYYEGETLRSRIEGGPLEIHYALSIAAQVASGLAAAHRKGIIHRDIKPENVLVTGDGVAKIVDFGIAKVAGQALTQTGVAVGTAAYMSPEQSFGTSVDHRTDLWSVGVVLYEMLFGERPFRGERQEAILLAIRSQPLELPEQHSRALPKGVRAIVEHCLEKDPDRRYSAAEDLAADLSQVRDGRAGPLKAEAEGTPRRAKVIPLLRRRARLVQILAAAAVVAAAGVVIIRGRATRDRQSVVVPRPNASASGATGLASTTAEAGSIAVLPFVNMSPSPDRDYIGDGIADELIHALTRVQNLRVVSRTSSFQYKGVNVDVREVGSRLGVASVLEGSVRSAGDRLRVTVQLIDARTGYELWSEVFNRSMKDILDVQEEISRAVVTKLRISVPVRLAGQPAKRSTDDPEAYALYLKGRQLWNERRQLPQAIKYFEQAIAKDSTFALAHLGLGQAWVNLPFYSDYPLAQAQESARAAILKALALDSTLAEAYGSLGSIAADSWKWREAEPHFRRAVTLTGGDATTRQWYGEMLLKVGRLDEAVRELRIASRLNPLSPVILSNLGWALYSAGRHEEAIATFNAAIKVDSLFGHARDGLGSVYLEQRSYSKAISQLERADQLMHGGQGSRAYLGRGYALGGRQAQAETILAQLKKEAGADSTAGSPWGVALLEVSLGRNDDAVKWLERAYDVRDLPMAYLNIDPAFKPLRSDPRFKQLLAKMGFL